MELDRYRIEGAAQSDLEQQEPHLRQEVLQNLNGGVEELARRALAASPLIQYQAQQAVQQRWQQYAAEEWRMSLLYLGIGGFIFWSEPLTVGIGLTAGMLLSAWEPLFDRLTYDGGSLFHVALRETTRDAADDRQSELVNALNSKFKQLLVGGLLIAYPTAYLATCTPIIGGYLSLFLTPITSGVALAGSAMVANRLFRHINEVHEEHHPEPAADHPPLLFRIEEVRQFWQERVVPGWNDLIARIPLGARAVVDPFRALDLLLTARARGEAGANREIPEGIARAYVGVRDWFTQKVDLLGQGAYTAHMLAAGLFGAWMCMADSPYLFTGSVVVAAYFSATTHSADYTMNPITRWLSPLTTSPLLLAGLGITYLLGKIVAFGFANGLAVSAYWRGPFSFPVYQVVSFAFVNTWLEGISAALFGVVAGSQLWVQSRRLYEEREQGLPENLVELAASRALRFSQLLCRYVGEGIVGACGDVLLRVLNPTLQSRR